MSRWQVRRPRVAAAGVVVVVLVVVLIVVLVLSAQPTHHRTTATKPAPPATGTTTIHVDAEHTNLRLAPGRDYTIVLPTTDTPLPNGVKITGGRNVTIDGGEIVVPAKPADEAPDENDRRALYLDEQTGVTTIEHVQFLGDLSEGIDINDGNTTSDVRLLDLTFSTVSGYSPQHHPDLLQTFAGPHRLLVDGFRGTTDYQGMFLQPNQLWHGPPPALYQLEDVDIDDAGGDYALWRSSASDWPLQVSDVCVTPPTAHPGRDQWLWPKPSTGDTSWTAVRTSPDCLGGG